MDDRKEKKVKLGEDQEDQICLKINWKGKLLQVLVTEDASVLQLKRQIEIITSIKVEKQKLLLKQTKIADEMKINQLQFKKDAEKKLMLIGTPEADLFVDSEKDYGVLDDLDVDFEYTNEDSGLLKDEKSLNKLQGVVTKLNINIINAPRPGKKLLVLDLDYTLFDMKSSADDFSQLKRPYTDWLLTLVYPHFDIVIWSQTSWRWLEIKLTELGLLTHPRFKISFVLDKTTMFDVESKSSNGEFRKHQVKALGIIWAKYNQWNATNTIHIDDLGRNFALNPQSGLKIKPYKHAHKNRDKDKELLFISQYLLLIGTNVKDFTHLNHSNWQKYLQEHSHELPS